VKHLLMNPAFPDLVGEWATENIDRKARVWTVTRAPDGSLEEALDLGHLLKLNSGRGIDEIVDALLGALGERDIAETRIW
jgi:hypothetical protein